MLAALDEVPRRLDSPLVFPVRDDVGEFLFGSYPGPPDIVPLRLGRRASGRRPPAGEPPTSGSTSRPVD
jgi:hypothetical protein